MKQTINGQITACLGLKTGTSKAGKEWKSQDYVLTEEDGNIISFNIFGDRIDQYGLTVGSRVSVTLEVKAREWNGRYFTQVQCVDCFKKDNGGVQVAPIEAQPMSAVEQHKEQVKQNAVADDLPF